MSVPALIHWSLAVFGTFWAWFFTLVPPAPYALAQVVMLFFALPLTGFVILEMLGANTLTHREQARLWVKGVSVHGAGPYKDCCPDFSCCGGPLAPLEERLRFRDADEDERMGMLMMFLGRQLKDALSDEDDPPSVYVSGPRQGWEDS